MLGRKRDPLISEHMRGYQRAKKERDWDKEYFHRLHLNALGCSVYSAAPPNYFRSEAHRQRFENAKAKAIKKLQDWEKEPESVEEILWFVDWPAPEAE